jgi:uncharacterized membrane protein YhfC
LGRAKWPGVLAFSIGFGAVEALVLGSASLTVAIAALAVPEEMPPEVMSQLAASANVLIGLAPICERFFTVWGHMFTTALVFYAVAVRKPSWFWVAFWYKSLIDAVAAYWQLVVLAGGIDAGKVWLVEAIVAVWGAAGWAGILWLRRRYAQLPVAGEHEADAPATSS